MTSYSRTMIRRLSVRGYRSLRDVDLRDLPEILVFYGPNGSGKSNLLRAVQLALRAAQLWSPLPDRRETSAVLSLVEANEKLGLRGDDFFHGRLPEIRIGLELSLGARAQALVQAPDITLGDLQLELVIQDTGDRRFRSWFERAEVGTRNLLAGAMTPVQRDIDTLERALAKNPPLLAAQRDEIEAEVRSPGRIVLDPYVKRIRDQRTALLANDDQALRMQQELAAAKEQQSQDALLRERIQRALLPELLQASGAYRAPGTAEDPTELLYAALLSEDQRTLDAALALGRQLGAAGLFGASTDRIEIRPVDATSHGEKQLRLRHPQHGFLPLRNLGTGQQQVVFLLGQRVVTPAPIAALEEPEAHLHVKLMEPLARALTASVSESDGVPAVDQLWIATHHHLFALAEEYFDVRLDDAGATQVERRPRDAAVAHFYEPSPYWDTLERLVKDGMSPETVLFRDSDGTACTAAAVLASVRGDRVLARRFVAAATEAFVLSLGHDEQAP